MRRILLLDGHPDPEPGHLVHALADAYAAGAAAGGHELRRLRLADLDFPLLRSQSAWMEEAPPPAIAAAQADLLWAQHILFCYPLWLGDVPALLKAFLEQALRPGFAFRYGDGHMPEKLLAGRSARIVVTMGMPALFYRLYYCAHSLKSLERNILNFVGIAPVARTIFGSVEGGAERREKWLARMEALGREGT